MSKIALFCWVLNIFVSVIAGAGAKNDTWDFVIIILVWLSFSLGRLAEWNESFKKWTDYYEKD